MKTMTKYGVRVEETHIIRYTGLWYIVRRGSVMSDKWWIERDGSCVCKIGSEDLGIKLSDFDRFADAIKWTRPAAYRAFEPKKGKKRNG